MYDGNPSLRKKGEVIEYEEWQIKEIIKCKQDIFYFAETYFKILAEDGFHVIKLREYQKRILKALLHKDPNEKRRHRVVLAPRQQGKTTIAGIFLLHEGLFGPQGDIGILAQKGSTAQEILDRIRIAIQELPLWLQQGLDEARGGFSKTCVAFENMNRIFCSTTSEDGLRGFSVRVLFLDEFGVIPKYIAEPFFAAVYGTISGKQNSRIIIASTPKGINLFYEIWKKAVRNENSFIPIKVNWWEMEGRDEEWKKTMIKDIGLKRFSQEFAVEFLGSSSTLLSPRVLEKQEFKDPIDTKYGGLLEIFKEYDDRYIHVLGVDTGKGLGSDYSSIQVLCIYDKEHVEQVAVYNNDQISPYDFAEVVHEVSKLYSAYIMLENNDQGGTVGDRLWYDFETEKLINCDKDGFGIRSTSKSKPKACLFLRRFSDNDGLIINCRTTLKQLSTFEEIAPNKFQGNGNHDDLVMSLVWGVYFIQTPFYEDILLTGNYNSSNVRVMNEDGDFEQNSDMNMPLVTDADFDNDFL